MIPAGVCVRACVRVRVRSATGMNEADILCGQLGCGAAREIPPAATVSWDGFEGAASVRVDCRELGPVEHLWQCAVAAAAAPRCLRPAAVVCTGRTAPRRPRPRRLLPD